MTIELTTEQTQALAAEGEALVLIDPRTNQAYRLVKEEAFKKVEALRYDDTPWTPAETDLLAGDAFSKLDDTDYSGYLGDTP
jgi:hypothetical protein